MRHRWVGLALAVVAVAGSLSGRSADAEMLQAREVRGDQTLHFAYPLSGPDAGKALVVQAVATSGVGTGYSLVKFCDWPDQALGPCASGTVIYKGHQGNCVQRSCVDGSRGLYHSCVIYWCGYSYIVEPVIHGVRYRIEAQFWSMEKEPLTHCVDHERRVVFEQKAGNILPLEPRVTVTRAPRTTETYQMPELVAPCGTLTDIPGPSWGNTISAVTHLT